MEKNNIKIISRIDIIGKINKNIPIEILKEIADAHGIFYTIQDEKKKNFYKILRKSIKNTFIKLKNKDKLKDLKKIARYVNKNEQWEIEKLLQAYDFLQIFEHDNCLDKIPDNFKYGLQTNEEIYNLNGCVLYKLCKENNIKIDNTTSCKKMEYAIKLLREKKHCLKQKAKYVIDKLSHKSDIINLLIINYNEVSTEKLEIKLEEKIEEKLEDNLKINLEDNLNLNCEYVDYEKLSKLYYNLNDVKVLRSLIEPTTNYGCIALAALNYNLDISKSKYPDKEYFIIKIYGISNYKPIDSWMNYWYNINKYIFFINKTFNPLFPEEYYNKNILLDLCKSHGYTVDTIRNFKLYSLLQISYLSKTFYFGMYPTLKIYETPIYLDNISCKSYDHSELLCYGTYDDLRPILISELIDLFKYNRNFTSPFDSYSVFSTQSINRLKYILNFYFNPPTTNSQTLLSLIISLESILSKCDPYTLKFSTSFRNASSSIQSSIISCFVLLLHIGMYMRGWSGPPSVYPISSSPSFDEISLSLNITHSINQFESLCLSLDSIGSLLLSLPIVKYVDGNYFPSKYSYDGFTISDRLDIIKQGDSTNNMASCIRLSSNWLCATAHKYLIFLGQTPPFDIQKLIHIS